MTDPLNCLLLIVQEKSSSVKKHCIENLPPTSAALKYHIQRAVFQASIVWGQSLVNIPQSHSPEHWGWEKMFMGNLIFSGLI